MIDASPAVSHEGRSVKMMSMAGLPVLSRYTFVVVLRTPTCSDRIASSDGVSGELGGE